MSATKTPFRHLQVQPTNSAYNEIVLIRETDVGRKISISTTHGIAASEPRGSITGFTLDSQGEKTAKQTRMLCQVVSITDIEHSPHYPALSACGGEAGEIHIIKANTEPGAEQVMHRLGILKSQSNKKVTTVNWNPVADCILGSTSMSGSLDLWDLQETAPKEKRSIQKVWNADWSPDGRLMATIDRNSGLNILDPRSPKPTQSRAEHAFRAIKPGQCRWVYDYQNLDSKNICALGFDGGSLKKIKLFDIRNFGEAVWEEKLTGGGNAPIMHFDPSSGLIFSFGRGESVCDVHILQDGKIQLLKEVSFGRGAAQVAFLPKRCVNVSKTEVVRVYRAEPEQMRVSVASFSVTRQEYADDIFTCLATGTPALSREMWLAGKDANVNTATFRNVPAGEQQFADANPPELPLHLPAGAE